MSLQLAKVVAQLIQRVAFGWNTKAGKNGGMDLRRPPARYRGAIVQQNFHQPDQARMVDFDAGEPDRPDGDGQCQPLKQRKSTWTLSHCA